MKSAMAVLQMVEPEPPQEIVVSDQLLQMADPQQPEEAIVSDPHNGELSGWSPLDDPTEGTPAFIIKKPLEAQPIDFNDGYLYILLEMNPGFEKPSGFTIEMERLEETPEISGDISMPADKTHMWQPTGSIVLPWSMPFPVSTQSGAFIGGELGSYRFRVWSVNGVRTLWRHFQVLDKSQFVIGEALKRQSQKKTGGFVPGKSRKNMKPQLMTKGGKKSLSLKFPELAIKGVSGLPAQICPNQSYRVKVTVVNQGALPAEFHLCGVGSQTNQCDAGQPKIHKIDGKMTKTLSMFLNPSRQYIEDGKWHGKIFLGKVRSQSLETGVTEGAGGSQSTGSSGNQTPADKIADLLDQGGDNPSPAPSACNVVVSTSWKPGGVGLSAGSLFCDNNMDNHLLALEIDSSAAFCNPIQIKKMDIRKMDIKKESPPGNKKSIPIPEIQEKQSQSGNEKIIPKSKVEENQPESTNKKIIMKPRIQMK